MAFGVKVKLGIELVGAAEIRSQIQQAIEKATQKDAIKIRHLSVELGEQESKRISGQLENAFAAHPITVKIESIDASDALAKLKGQLTTMLSGLSITGLKEFLGTDGVAETYNKAAASAEKLAKAQENVQIKTRNANASLKTIGSIQSVLNSVFVSFANITDSSKLESYLEVYNRLLRASSSAKDMSGAAQVDELNRIMKETAALKQQTSAQLALEDAARKVANAKNDVSKKAGKPDAVTRALLKDINAIQSVLNTVFKGSMNIVDAEKAKEYRQTCIELREASELAREKNGSAQATEVKNIMEATAALKQKLDVQREAEKLAMRAQKTSLGVERDDRGDAAFQKKAAQLYSQMNKWATANPKAYKAAQTSIDNMMSSIFNNSVKTLPELKRIDTEFQQIKTTTEAAGLAGQSFFGKLKAGWDKFGTWLFSSKTFMMAVRTVKKMVNAVMELDAAMVELKKVTSLTESQYQRFLNTSIQTAKRIGASAVDTVNASASFARLGYNPDDALKLAEVALVYKNVGDGIESIDAASESLISTLKAFGIEAGRAMTVVDMFNEVGNNFAISSTGIGDALLNSAASLAAAGNSLGESIALITAANEVIQNPEKVGTALKTMSMYIRAAKTEAEDAGIATDGMANSVSELRDEILALTGQKVDIMIDKNTYKSTVQILRELSAVWDNLSDITRTNITELIGGGVRNANVIAALVKNFDTVENVIATASNSAGSALAENEKFLDGIGGRLQILKATFQEFSSNVISSGLIKFVVDVATWALAASNAIAKLISSLGGLTTVLHAVAGALIAIKLDSVKNFFLVTIPKMIDRVKLFFSWFKKIPKVIKEYRTSAGYGFTATNRLNKALKEAGISATTAQLAIGALTAVITIAVAAIQRHKQKIQEQRDAAIEASNTASEYSNEIIELTERYIGLNEAIKTDASVKDNLLATEDELLKKLDIEESRLRELTEQYGNLTDAMKAAAVEALKEQERDIRGGLNAARDSLVDKADEVKDSAFAAAVAQINPKAGLPMGNTNRGLRIVDTLADGVFSTSDEERKKQIQLYKGLHALERAGFANRSEYNRETENGRTYSRSFSLQVGADADLDNADDIVKVRERLGEMLDVVEDAIGSENILYDAIYSKYNGLKQSTETYTTKVDELNNVLAQQYVWLSTIGKELPNTKTEFDEYRQSVIDIATESGKFAGTGEDIADAIDSVLQAQSQFSSFYDAPMDAVGYYKAQLSSLTDVMSKLQSAYSALEKAESDMTAGKGLTVETINALASAEDKYLDYIYEENGVLKLNTDAWRENSNAKMLSEMAQIEAETASLAEQNRILQEESRIAKERLEDFEKHYEEYAAGHASSAVDESIEYHTKLVNDNNKIIAENSDRIRENQGLLAVYGAIYASITGDITAYNAALENFANIADVIDSVASSYTSLANLQKTVAKGFTLSLDKILEYAKAYPQILDNAKVAANGELELNETVVNSFIAGQKAKLVAQIDSQIAELEADKAVLEAKKEFAATQLELAKAAINGESKLNSEFATYKINLGNGLAEALIAMEVDRAEAYKLATAAMAGNEEEFARVAAECFENIDANSSKAAYDMARAFFTNSKNATISIAEIAEQAHSTAYAIAGMAQGVIAGSSKSTFNGANGVYTAKYGFTGVDSTFEGVDYDYKAKTISLDEYIADLEIDISDYEQAIAQVNGQIATLEALRNTPFADFKKLVGNASNVVGGLDKDAAGKAEKAVEEYIAAIDQYYAALKRLAEVQERRQSLEKKLEHANDLSEKIFLSSGLVDVYREEADAEQNLMAAKQATIAANIGALRGLGFDIDYDNAKNELFIRNLEHLNSLAADSAGEYDTLQDATNALRKETEELISATEQLNKDNVEAANNIEDLGYQVQETKEDIVDYIEEIYNKQVESYQKIIDLRKELIESARDEYDYESDIADKVKEIAELQTRIDQLALDDSRSARAERNTLMQELSEKQQELAQTQGDHATDAQLEALDKMSSDYSEQRANEIQMLRDSVNDSEELWSAFYQTILGQNVEIGDSIDELIAGAWIRAAKAVNDYSASLNGVPVGATIVGSVPKFHDGGVVNEANLGKEEALAILQKGEVVLNEGKQRALYKIIDFQAELSNKLGTAIRSLIAPEAIGSIRPKLSNAMAGISENRSVVFEPHIQVLINHNGEMTGADAKGFGEQIANTAIEKLYNAFTRRGIGSPNTSMLRP